MPILPPLRLGPINPIALARSSGITRRPALFMNIPKVPRPGLRGLGLDLPSLYDAGNLPADDPSSVLGAISLNTSAASIYIPGVGTVDTSTISQVKGWIDTLESWLGIGSGRREADIIVPVQNQLSNSWQPCVNAILVAAPCNLAVFNQCYRQVWAGAVAFMQFVQQRNIFTDGRASQQALNTIMPYIDGSCGYHWPPPMRPTMFNCINWGVGTIGGNGTTGILGAIDRTIRACGGSGPPGVEPSPTGQLPHPNPPGSLPLPLVRGLSGTHLLLVGLGVFALAMYGRRRG